MFAIRFLLPIAFLALVKEASGSKDKIEFKDKTSTQRKGKWIVHAIQGDSPEIKLIACYYCNVTKKGSQLFSEMVITLSSGKTFNMVYQADVDVRQGVDATFYEINEDGSRGPKTCDMEAESDGHVVKFAALETCKIGTILDYKAICFSKDNVLSPKEQKSLDTLCPPSSSQRLKTNC